MAQEVTLTGSAQVGSGQVIAPGIEQTVDPLYMASRIALRPLDYTGQGGILGHYAVSQLSGNTVSLAASAHVGRLRWAPSGSNNNVYCVLMRLKMGWVVQAAVTAAVPMVFDAVIARGFTVDYSANNTIINMAAPPRQNAMRSGQGPAAMSSSLMGVNGPAICTTAAMTGQTLTADNAAFAMTTFNTPSILTGTVSVPIGIGGIMNTMYELTAAGQHPVTLSVNEGVVVRQSIAGVVTGAMQLAIEWTWAEVFVF